MKLLLDANLSPRLVARFQDTYPGSMHVREEPGITADDASIWAHAKTLGCAIITKDTDFIELSLLFGHPPKVIYLRIGNCSTDTAAATVDANRVAIAQFFADPDAALLVVDR